MWIKRKNASIVCDLVGCFMFILLWFSSCHYYVGSFLIDIHVVVDVVVVVLVAPLDYPL